MDFFRRRSKALKPPANQAPRQFDKRHAEQDTAERPRVRSEAEPGDRNNGGVDRTSPSDRS